MGVGSTIKLPRHGSAGHTFRCKGSRQAFRWSRLIKSWSTDQWAIALSSGEVELYALTRRAARTMGTAPLARGMGEITRGST